MRQFVASLGSGGGAIVPPIPFIEYLTSLTSITDTSGIVAQKGVYKVRCAGTTIYFSEDGGATYPYSTAFADASSVVNGFIFANGSFFVYTNTAIYGSTDKLTTFGAIPLKDEDGNAYTIHTPVNPSFPGTYFQMLTTPNTQIVGGKEMVLWGNYKGVIFGECPAVLWYTTEDLTEVKAAYEFGQNTERRDNGTALGGTTGTLFGKAANTIMCRHIHSTYYDYNGTWWVFTGDLVTGDGFAVDEIHWLKCTYNSVLDSWNVSVEVTPPTQVSRFKSVGMRFIGSDIYWGSDATNVGTNYTENGLWKAPIATFDNPATHISIYNYGASFPVEIVDLMYDIEQETFILWPYRYNNKFRTGRLTLVRKDGSEIKGYDFGSVKLGVGFEKDSDGYYLINTNWIESNTANKIRFKWYG